MSKQELDDEDYSSTDSEDTDTSDNISKDSESDTDSSWKKKSSTKEYINKLKKQIRELKQNQKSVKSNNDDDFEDEEDEDEEVKAKSTSFDETKFDIFLLKNPWAEEYEKEIKKVLKTYPNMPFSEALSFAKVHYTKSESRKDFDTKGTTPKKELKDMTKEEVVALGDSKKLLEWSRSTWRLGK